MTVEALPILREKYDQIVHAVFCGSDCGNLKFVLNLAKEHRVETQIHYLSFISNELLFAYYSNATALVMPSFFGPTNLPPLEAMQLGIPVIVSDLPGIRDQIGDGGLIVSPFSADDLAKEINLLISDNKHKDSIVKKGFIKLNEYSDNKRIKTLKDIFTSFQQLKSTWT